jgi:hypothetical protein
MRWLLVILVSVALLAFLAVPSLLLSSSLSRAALVHLVLAVGIMPLIMGAMSYFTPVLTRSRSPERTVLLVPVPAMAAGAVAFASLTADVRFRPVAAALAMLACGALFLWIWWWIL